jgi:GT2 family glycosyltransferase
MIAKSDACSIIVPNYNGARFLPGLVRTLQSQAGVKLEFIVVDNGSNDGFANLLPPTTKLIKLDKNYGFSYAVNRGIEQATYAYILLLNNDMTLEPQTVVKLVDFLNSHPDYCFVQPKLKFLNQSDVINNVGDLWSVYGIGLERGFGEVDGGQYDFVSEIFSATAGAVLYRKEVLEKIGKFDEHFFCYIEDLDLGFRLRLEGFKGAVLPQAVVYHGFESTSKEIPYFSRFYITRNSLFLMIKNIPVYLFIKYLPQFLSGQLRILITGIVDGCLHLVLKAYYQTMLNLPYLMKERFRIQSLKRITNKELDSWLVKRRPFKIFSK